MKETEKTAFFSNRKGYRHEFKYVIDPIQLESLRERLPVVLSGDPYAGPAGVYEVRSLYFDDYRNSCYKENEDGTDPREKFRIRIYNGSPSRLSLELKRKQAGMTLKRSCLITLDQFEGLFNGTLKMRDDMPPLLKKMIIQQETRLLRPKIIVEYDRVPFVYRDGNVRVTLDTNIRSSADLEYFLEPASMAKPIMPVGNNLLEVKFDDYLPDFIKRAIHMKGLRQTAFSKYYLCRKFGGLSV
ncbi:MAG: polyphosphate polymerase domain-containing protein [Clostridia bacterium]|nr:polyphosphate polymerase domain-containing protein [Clostridia bacterium]